METTEHNTLEPQGRVAARTAAAGRGGVSLAALLFFLSGATALTYEVLWFRRFAHAWGSSSLAMAAVLAAFLLGLGLGARWLGGLADRLRRPLLGYAACEAGIGLWALAIPFLAARLGQLDALLAPHLAAPALRAGAQVVLATLVLGPPCILMGATLPLFVRQFARQREGLGLPTSWFYAINTLGAAFGCGMAGFVLLPVLGLGGTRTLAVALNLLVAAAACPLAARLPVATPRGTDDAGSARAAVVPPATLALAAGAVGFAALVLQMVWARQLAVLLGGSTYAFSAMLLVVLLGLGLGSLALERILAAGRDPLRGLGAIALLLALSLLAGQAAIPALSELAGALMRMRANALFNAALCAGASAALELLPSLCAGLVFPLLVHLAGGGPARAGHTVGRVYLWNTLGTAVGALAAHALLIPLLGTRASLLVALGLYLLAFALLAGSLPAGRRLGLRLALFALLAAAVSLAPRLDPLVTERGLYVYGQQARDVFEGGAALFHREGPTCNVLVTEQGGQRSLRVNGKVDASTLPADQITQVGSAYLPRFLRPRARRVFVLGYGSGATAGASLQLPGTRVTCCEIEPAVYAASDLFARVNHSPERSPDFRIVLDDGRAVLRADREQYDLIITEPSNPWMAGISGLFTREFFEIAAARLAPDGLLAQWLHGYALSPAEYRLVVRTLRSVFPQAALLRLTGGDTVLLASRAPILPPPESIELAQRITDSLPVVRRDLAAYLGTSDVRALLVRHLVLGDAQMEALADQDGRRTLNTDSNLRLEFDAPLRLFDTEREPGERVDRALFAALDPSWQRRLLEALGGDRRAVPGLRELIELAGTRGREDALQELIELGLELDPTDTALSALRLIHLRPPEPVFSEVLASVVERSTSEALTVALAAAREGDHARALAALDLILERRPSSTTARAHRAVTLWWLDRRAAARAEVEELAELDPLNEAVRAALRLVAGAPR